MLPPSFFLYIKIRPIVFFLQKRETVDWVKWMMDTNGYDASAITGAMTKEDRLWKFHQFKTGTNKILIATNLMARGFDIPGTKLVINFDIPTNENGQIDTKSFIHRIGRAGRFGTKAAAITLLNEDEIDDRQIEQIGEKFNRQLQTLA